MVWTKLDDTTVGDDASASTHVAHALRRNVAGLVTDRHMGCSICYDEDAPPVLSTHPDYWHSIPLLLPATVGAESVVVELCYEVASTDTTQSVDVAFRVEGVQSSTSTLTHTGSPSTRATVTLTVDAPFRRGRWWRGELLVRSRANGTSVASVEIEELRLGGRVVHCSKTAGSPPYATLPGKAHLLMELTALQQGAETRETRYHISRIDSRGAAGDCEVSIWPPMLETTPATTSGTNPKSDTADYYYLSTLTIRSLAIYYEGDSGELVTSPETATEPGRPVRSSHVRRLFDALSTLRRDRRRWWAASLVTRGSASEGYSRTDAIGAYSVGGSGNPLTISEVIVERRDGAVGVRVALLAGQLGDGALTVSATLGGSTTTTTVTPTYVGGGATGRVPVAFPLIGYNLTAQGDEWGAIDSGGIDDVHILGLHEVLLPWGTLAVGDQGLLSVEVYGDRLYQRVYTCAVLEEY